jgi:hypothetical protein
MGFMKPDPCRKINTTEERFGKSWGNIDKQPAYFLPVGCLEMFTDAINVPIPLQWLIRMMYFPGVIHKRGQALPALIILELHPLDIRGQYAHAFD